MRNTKIVNKGDMSKLSILYKKLYYIFHPNKIPKGVSRIEFAWFYGYDDK